MKKFVFYLFLLYVYTIPIESIIMMRLGTINRISGVVLSIFFLLYLIRHGRINKIPSSLFMMILFFLFSSLSYFWSINDSATIQRNIIYLQLIISVWLIYEIISDEKKYILTLQFYVFGAVTAALFIVYQFLFFDQNIIRYTAFSFNINDLALLLCLALPIAWFLGYERKTKYYFLNYLFIIVMIFSALLSGSRSVFLSVSIFLLFLVASIISRKFNFSVIRNNILVILLSASILLFIINNIPVETMTRMTGILNFDNEFSQLLGVRNILWRASVLAFYESPILGVGAGAGRYAIATYFGEVFTPHNVFFVHLVDLGLIGIILFLSYNISCIKNILKMDKSEKKYWVVLIIILIIALSSMNWYHNKAYWLFLGILIARKNILKKNNSATMQC